MNDTPKDKTYKDVYKGYWELWTYKFKTYLGSVSRYTQNQRLKERPYRG